MWLCALNSGWLYFIAGVALTLHIVLTWYLSIRRGIIARRQPEENAHLKEMWPSVSIIIPAWCERGTIETCIESLLALDYPFWEAIIVAGGPDATYRVVREIIKEQKNFQVIEQKPIGKNAAVNQGITAATGELLVFLDADSRVEPDWLRELVRPLGASAQATTGSILPLRSTPISAGIQMEYIAAQEIDQANNLFGAGSIALQRSIIQQMGGLPEEVSVGVDWDLNLRLASQQICRAYCKRAIVHTELPASIQDFWRNELRWRRAHLSSIQRFPDYFFSDPAKVIDHIYIYILAWAAVAATLGVAILVLITGGHLAVQTLVPWAAMAAWVLLRRAALAAEVAAYTRDLAWLRWVWVPPLLLVVTLVAIIPASLSISKQNIHFKGPRPAKSSQSRGISQ